ncbi:MAG: aldo/keto reductase [Rhodothermaceae bacterium]|nr:aldo/keto reductase [Rhodothermaceae bacterium]
MITIDLQGIPVPALGFGTWRLRGDEARTAINTALGAGYRHLDTAQMYENEAEVGQAIRQSGVEREALFLTTKLWRDDLHHADVLRATDESLRRLGTEYVDLLLIHWPNEAIDLRETLDAFQEVRTQGKTRLIGVSNFTPSLLAQALDHVPDLTCNQVEYHPFLNQQTLLELVRKHGMMLTAYSPIVRGTVAENYTIRAIAETHGKSPVQVTLRWLLQQDRVAAIPRSATPDHITANLNLFDFALSEDEMDRMDALAENRRLINPDFAPAWEG